MTRGMRSQCPHFLSPSRLVEDAQGSAEGSSERIPHPTPTGTAKDPECTSFSQEELSPSLPFLPSETQALTEALPFVSCVILSKLLTSLCKSLKPLEAKPSTQGCCENSVKKGPREGWLSLA